MSAHSPTGGHFVVPSGLGIIIGYYSSVSKSNPVVGKIFGHNQPVEILVFASPTGNMFTSSGSPLLNWVYSINSSKMVGNFPALFNFNRLFLKLNRFICN